MSASLRTKDGSFSVVNAILNGDKERARQAPIEMESAIEWARKNKVDLSRTKNPLDRINGRRTELGLPPFKIIKGGAQSTRSRPGTIAPNVNPLAVVVSSEDDLLDKITAYNGTLTGLVTPQIAGWLLKLNTNNRPLERRGLERFSKILKNGTWLNTGEPVIVSREGVLNDGQHRLTAISSTGITAELDVRFGIIREAFRATGTGRARTAGHALSIEGYSNTTCQAAVARLMLHYDNGQMGNRQQVEIGDILRVVDSDDQVCEIAAKIQRLKFAPTKTAAFGFVLAVAARSAPLEQVLEFAELVASGKYDYESAPTRRLHVRLRDAAMKHERINPIDMAILTVKTWNAWLDSASATLLRVVESDRTNAGFPRVREWLGGRPGVS